MQSFNVTRFQIQDRATIELRDPVTQGLTAGKIHIAGPNSLTQREAAEALRQRRQALVRRYKKADAIPVEESLKAFQQYLADLTLGWDGITEGEGADEKPLAFSRANAVTLYENPAISEQVAAYINEIAGFIKG